MKVFYEMPVTIVLIILNGTAFMLTEAMGGSENVRVMLEMGAAYTPYIIEQEEYYRLFMSMFLHFGISHLFNNMLLLFLLGKMLENTVGKLRFLSIYVVGGVLANLVSLWGDLGLDPTLMPVSAGASGAVFAIMGALLSILLLDRRRLPSLTIPRFVLMIFLALWQGFSGQNVNNMAHVAGLIAGFMLGLLLYREPKVRS